MGGEGQNIILIIIIVAVAVIVMAWLIHFILGIRKTQKAYREIMEQKRREALSDHEGETAVPERQDQSEEAKQ